MVRSIFEQTGWKGVLPVTICQEFDVLTSINEYDFDLNNLAFQNYCKKRGILHKAGIEKRFLFTANHSATKKQFFEEFRFGERVTDPTLILNLPQKDQLRQRYEFTDKELEIHWKIMLAAKGAFQDCWEIFTGKRQSHLNAAS